MTRPRHGRATGRSSVFNRGQAGACRCASAVAQHLCERNAQVSRITRTVALALITVLFAAMSTSALAQSPAQPRGKGGPIRLRAASFNPSAGERAAIPARLTRAPDAGGTSGYYIVQFSGPVRQQWKDSLAAMGATLLDYIPENAFKVRMTADQAAALRGLATVAWVGPFEPAYALSPALAPAGSQQLARVNVERGGDRQAVIALAARLGAAVAESADGSLLIAADRSQIEQLAAQSRDVAWVEPYVVFQKHNEYGGGQIIGGAIANSSGYDGSTQIAAVADTGLGGGTAASAHRDIPASRITAIYNWPGVTDSCFRTITNDGAVDVDSGHGTHVAGSVLGGGDPVTGVGKGVAPAAHLVFQATENWVTVSNLCRLYGYTDGYYLTGLNDLNALFLQAYNAGARVHANSWGSAAAGDYTDTSVTADSFIWGHPDMTITFSAGNEGADANNDGVVDSDSIGAPATAKNVITIGASENNRQGNYQCDSGLTYTSDDSTYQGGQTCASMGGNNLLGTPGQRWGFSTPPISSDPTAGNAEQMAAFSSRGPTDDGRIKPDVVAPGTWILSTYSDMYQRGYDASPNPRNNAYQMDGWGIPLNAYYKYFGGTSMSNPIAAGAATVVRDFYQKAHSVNASAALVKATLINSAVDLLDENNDGVNDNDFPIPNVHEGWGRIDLAAATDDTAEFVDNTAGLSTGGSYVASYSVPGGQPFKVSLVWSDYPSTAAAAANLVNNLNLTVTSPGGTVYRGNVFSGGWSVAGGSADAVNNVENVYIQSAAQGSWTVSVSAPSVPQGPQPFALVVRGASVAPPPPPPGAPSGLSATAASSSQINLSWSAGSGTVSGYTVERCQGAGCASFAAVGTSTTTSFSDSGLSAGTSYSYRVFASNAGGDSGYSNTASATTGSGPSVTGFLSPSANSAVTSGSGDNNGYEGSPQSAYANDGVFATDTNSGSRSSTSCSSNRRDRHIYYNYGVSLPGGASVSGIEVRLDAKADSSSGAPAICVELSSDGGATWTAAKTTATLTTSEATYIVGGASDTWGRSWSSTNLSNASFRVRLTNVASSTARDFSLDWVSVQVTYQ